jgi:transglutaminase-like putative cysteine protease
MTMLLHVRHETLYRYAEPVKYSAQSLRLTPRRESRQRALAWQIAAPGRRVEQVDAYGNVTHLLTLEEPHREIRIAVQGVVETNDDSALLPNEGPLSPLAYLAPTRLTAADAGIQSLTDQCLSGGAGWRERLDALVEAIGARLRYRPGVTDVSDTAEAALARGEGVCQDYSHIMIACCRAAGVPARYVSGYLYTDAPRPAASHAWVDVWMADEEAWLGVDVTRRGLARQCHCRLAVGRDYLDAAPVRGVRRGGGAEAMHVNVNIATSSQQ